MQFAAMKKIQDTSMESLEWYTTVLQIHFPKT